MTRRAFRIAISTLGLCTLAACVVNIAIDMQKNIAVQTQAGITSIDQQQAINLNDYPDYTAHKGNIKSLDLDSADVTVASVDPSNKATKVISGSLKLRQNCTDSPANDIIVGTQLSNFSLAANSTIKLPGSPELDTFLMNQVNGAGTFCVIVDGSIDAAPVNVTLSVTLHASLGYDTGLF
ncbi:MAG TPA: hypothetical protein VLW85_01265 [Myxococcales bacterium]|nr:hypothetical protein [Myxococcales bacterium]